MSWWVTDFHTLRVAAQERMRTEIPRKSTDLYLQEVERSDEKENLGLLRFGKGKGTRSSTRSPLITT